MRLVHNASGTWVRVTDAQLVDRARQLITVVVERTVTTDQLTDLVLRAAEQAERPVGWYPPSLACGRAGSALLHLYAARAGIGTLANAFGHIREAVLSTQMEPLEGHGLFSGTSGLALALADCARDESRFRPSLDRLHERLAEQVLAMELPRSERAVSDLHYDLISGAAGTLAQLSSVPQPTRHIRDAAGGLIAYLMWLAEPAGTPGTAHRWLITPEFYPPVGGYHERYPHGYLNLGFSHGVPGVAAALASAWEAGHRHPGQLAAVDTLTSWIRARHQVDTYGPVWPDGIPVGEDGAELTDRCAHDQFAWCYGSAGVAASLLTVAQATDDGELRAAAVDAFEAALRRSADTRSVSPTLCHGHAGLVMLCQEFAPWSALASENLSRLVTELLDYGDPELPLGFSDQEVSGNFVDDPTLLTGATGVALTLLAAIGGERPSWFRTFLAR
ncbi:lanthionine synthetase C family protein [Streptomyces sp. NPDC088789]|uniref:lanthionine synthetase C family protein n=1 Tax=Streptomyces sp. NPDC088789 TaxID=3365899 RepID=UPI0038155A97